MSSDIQRREDRTYCYKVFKNENRIDKVKLCGWNPIINMKTLVLKQNNREKCFKLIILKRWKKQS